MATRRKLFVPEVIARKDVNLYAAFIKALLDGRVQAIKLIETRLARRNRLRLAYDDPNG
jgi:hypothetical protein